MTMSMNEPRRKIPKCPACGKPRLQAYRPFCSARCRDRDLAKWIDGAYAIPAVEQDDDRDSVTERENESH
ncbi:MAG: DNA gyrase inhibitor YacG [Pseudomonadota bacterium]